MAGKKSEGGLGAVLEELPTDRLVQQARELMTAVGERALSAAGDKAGETTEKLLDYVENGAATGGGRGSMARTLLSAGAKGVKNMVSEKLTGGRGGGGKGGGGKKLKVTNIVEQIDVGVPVRVAYNQWTQFQDFPKFTKRVETVEQESDEKLTWKAGIFLSHRTWQSSIVEQVPDEMIVWQSKGEKGRVDGTVTFHELAPNLTRILLVLAYYPQGLFERTGNVWRAQGRRARLELKHFRRHVMTQTILDPDGVEGWRGEIHDGEVSRTHEEAMEDEGAGEDAGDEEAAGEELEDEELEDTEPEDVESDEEGDESEEAEDDASRDEEPYDDEDAYESDDYDDEFEGEEDDEDEPAPRSRSRRTAARSR